MSEQSIQLLQTIKDRLQATARRRFLTQLVFGLVLVAGILAGIWLLVTGIEVGFWLETTSRSLLFWLILGVAVCLFSWFVALPLLRMIGLIRGPSTESLARDIGTAYPQISDRLINLLHLADGRRSSAPAPFVDHAVRSLSRHIETVPFEKMDSFDKALKTSRLASLPLVGLLVFWLVAPGAFKDASLRLLSPGATFQRPAPFQMQVMPGSIELIRGDSLRLDVTLVGSEQPNLSSLKVRNEGEEKISEQSLSAQSLGHFQHTFVNVRRSFAYRIEAGEIESPWYEVTIVERPIIRSLQVALQYPGYSRIPAQRLEANVGDVQALPGTLVQLEIGVSGKDIVQALVVQDNGRQDTLSLESELARGSFVLRREGYYQIQLTDTRGITNSNPIKYSLKLLPDAHPTIILIDPNPLHVLNESMSAPLRSRITDDFGFSRLRLMYRLSESQFGETMPEFEAIPLQLESPTDLDQEISFEWLISEQTSLDLVPGDVVEYYLQVWDNDRYAGYKSSKSATHQLRLPSLAEQYEELDLKEDQAEEEMEELLSETKEVKEQFEELRDELRNKLESDWEDQRQLEQLKEKQAELESRVEDLSESFEEMTSQMEENNLASDETMQMYQEMQQVLEEINSPELMDALNELQKAMQELDLQQMQESLSDFEMNEEQYQQRLERTLELFKQLRVQQDLEEVARRAEELAEQQEKLQEETQELAEEENAGEEGEEENAEGENQEGEQQEGENQEGEQQEGENQEGEQQEGENQEGEQQEGENQEGKQQEGENQDGEQQEGEEAPRNEELAEQQERSKEEMEALEEQLEQIMERMEELQNAPSEDMQQLNEQVQDQQIPEQMEQNAEQLRNEQFDQAQQQQQQMQQQLQQMQQQLQQMQQGMQGAQMQLNLSGLRRALSDILTLSQLQEDIREQVRNLASDSPAMREHAQQQVEMGEGLSIVSDSLQQLAKQIPQMSREVQQHAGDALREMTSAVEAMTDRVANRASGHQKESMMHLNELALLLSDLLNEMMNSQGSGGGGMSMQQMIQQLQNAAGQQQKLNQQIQQMLNEMQGNRLSQDMQERLRQMAAQQEQIKSQVKQLSRNRELRGQVMGDLNRIAQQMEETIRELQRNRPNQRTIERQQQILTRLLDATKSLQERGREKRREGQIGEEEFRESPDALTPSEEADRLRRALIEALDSGYAPDYEELIKRYFELLQEKSLEER